MIAALSDCSFAVIFQSQDRKEDEIIGDDIIISVSAQCISTENAGEVWRKDEWKDNDKDFIKHLIYKILF